MHGQADLLEIVQALRAAGALAGGLNRRQQQRHQHADDRDHDQQLDQRKAAPMAADRDMITPRVTSQCPNRHCMPKAEEKGRAAGNCGRSQRQQARLATGYGDRLAVDLRVRAGCGAVLARRPA